MRQLKLREGDLYISEDYFKELTDGLVDPENGLDLRIMFSIHLDRILRGKQNFKDYIDAYGRIKGLERCALIAAHGGDSNGKWNYTDGKRKKLSVQNLINSLDGKYAALFFFVCNTGALTPKSKKSILVIPDQDVALNHDVTLPIYSMISMIVPDAREVNSYTVESDLEKLLKSDGREE